MIDRESLVLCSYYLDNPALRRFDAIIRPEHFQEPGRSMLFTVLQKYHQEYGRMPTHQEAEMEVRFGARENWALPQLPCRFDHSNGPKTWNARNVLLLRPNGYSPEPCSGPPSRSLLSHCLLYTSDAPD